MLDAVLGSSIERVPHGAASWVLGRELTTAFEVSIALCLSQRVSIPVGTWIFVCAFVGGLRWYWVLPEAVELAIEIALVSFDPLHFARR